MFKKLLLATVVLVGGACAMAGDGDAGSAGAPSASGQGGFILKAWDGTKYYAQEAGNGVVTILGRVDGYTGISAVASKKEWEGHYLKNMAKIAVCAALVYGAYKLLTHKTDKSGEPTQVITNDGAASA